MTHQILSHDSLAALGGPEASTLDARSVLSTTRVPLSAKELVPGIVIGAEISLDLASLQLDVKRNGVLLWSTLLNLAKLQDTWSGNQGVVKENLTFGVDLSLGELTVSGDICVLGRSGWLCHRFADEVIFAWSPTIGSVGGSIWAHPPEVNDSQSGSTRSLVPTIIRIPIDTVKRVGTPVGSMVKETFFPGMPDFLFNVCFSVGDFSLLAPGTYGDPASAWFNVFVGYYQIDCPRPAWTRPFGYDLSGDTATVNFDDLLRIGKADWNYFSNWMYGVPIEAVKPYDRPDPGVKNSYLGRHTVGTSQWDLVDLDGFSAVTAYQSDAQGAAQLVENSILSLLWRVTYGWSNPQPGDTTSFIGSKMHAQLYMAFSADEKAFHTVLFGGTVNKAFDGHHNQKLLQEQKRACEAEIAAHYPALGFAR